MKRYLPTLIVVFVGILTLASATALYRAKRPAPLGHTTLKAGEVTANHVRGNPAAPVTLEEFGDFECPPCSKLSEPLNDLEKDYKGRVRLVFRNFPLPMHPHAREAALAAEAAGMQGRFWEMHDLLYREQASWSKASDVRALFSSYAGVLGLDVQRFKKDIDGEDAKNRVTSDQKEGSGLGVKNTPTLFLNNNAVDPKDFNPQALRAAIDNALKAKGS